MPIFLIETLSTHKITYAIKANTFPDPGDFVVALKQHALPDLKQEHQEEAVLQIDGPFTDEEYIKKHDEMFPNIELDNADKLLVIDYELLKEAPDVLDYAKEEP